VLDRTARDEEVGCRELAIAVERLRPRLHVFGHIHEAGGSLDRLGGASLANVSHVDFHYRPARPAAVFEL
jgi:Icc-related predicted phosphoesterase